MQIIEVGIDKRYLELKDCLRHAQIMFHVFKEPVMNDMRYDHLCKELRETLKVRPELAALQPEARSIRDQIFDHGKLARHDFPMLRLNRKHDISGLVNWLKILPKGSHVDITTKVIGVSLELIYIEGRLHKAITKGDGMIGRDVTINAYCIKGIPDLIDRPGRTVVRGTVTTETLVVDSAGNVCKLDPEQLKGYVTAQLVKSNPDKHYRDITFIAHSITNQNDEFKTWSEWEWKLRMHGFTVPKCYSTNLPADVYEFGQWEEDLNKIKERILNSNYLPPFNGLVFAVSEMEHRYDLGYTSRFPEWAIAFTPDKDFTNVLPKAT